MSTWETRKYPGYCFIIVNRWTGRELTIFLRELILSIPGAQPDELMVRLATRTHPSTANGKQSLQGPQTIHCAAPNKQVPGNTLEIKRNRLEIKRNTGRLM